MQSFFFIFHFEIYHFVFPCKAVVMRGKESGRQAPSSTSDVNGLRDDIAMIQSRLETKNMDQS